MGQIVVKENLKLNKALSHQINMKGIEKWIYYLNVKTEQGAYFKKMMVRGE